MIMIRVRLFGLKIEKQILSDVLVEGRRSGLPATMIVSRNALSKIRAASVARRSLSSRASAILSSLDISTSKELPGVYDGQWKGSGDVFESVCPTTGEILARVQSVSVINYSLSFTYLNVGF